MAACFQRLTIADLNLILDRLYMIRFIKILAIITNMDIP